MYWKSVNAWPGCCHDVIASVPDVHVRVNIVTVKLLSQSLQTAKLELDHWRVSVWRWPVVACDGCVPHKASSYTDLQVYLPCLQHHGMHGFDPCDMPACIESLCTILVECCSPWRLMIMLHDGDNIFLSGVGLASELITTSGVATYDGSLSEMVVPGRTKAVQETVYIGVGKCVVDETGQPMPIAKMRKPQVVAELQV